MKIEKVERFKVGDKEFATMAEAERAADGVWRERLAGLTAGDIDAAISGGNRDIMAAALKWAAAINKGRDERGEVKRRAKMVGAS